MPIFSLKVLADAVTVRAIDNMCIDKLLGDSLRDGVVAIKIKALDDYEMKGTVVDLGK